MRRTTLGTLTRGNPDRWGETPPSWKDEGPVVATLHLCARGIDFLIECVERQDEADEMCKALLDLRDEARAYHWER